MDEADLTQERAEKEEEVKRRNTKPFELAVGVQGECELCGEWSGRLVDGACAPCRDKYHLP